MPLSKHTIKITALMEEDIAACLRIYNYYIKNTCFTLEEDELDLASFSQRCNGIAKRYPFIVTKNEKGEVLGYAYLNTFNERSAYRQTADLSIYVSPYHLHEHVGGILLEEIEKLAKERGITNIISIITSENENSLRFHLHNGFLLEGTIHDVAFKLGKHISVHYLRKSLLD